MFPACLQLPLLQVLSALMTSLQVVVTSLTSQEVMMSLQELLPTPILVQIQIIANTEKGIAIFRILKL